MKRKDDNRGFTLVELVIAVAILAIAVAPLVGNFIQSSKLNLKSRGNLNATALAQDIMEGMSAYSATELDEIIRTASGNSLTQKILPSDASYKSDSVRWDTTVADKFVYTIGGIKLSTGGQRSEYDVKITLDASNSNYSEYNKEAVAEISSYDQYYDAVYNVPTSDINAAAINLKQLSTNQKPEIDYIDHMIRNMNIVIKDEGVAGTPNYAVYVNNVYSVETSKQTELGLTNTTNSATISSGNISKTGGSELPKNVYVYFEGMERAGTAGVENINITNTTGKPITVYLIRIQDKASITLLDSYNSNYKCKVVIKSTDPTSGTAVDNVDIVTNLRFHLGHSLEENFRRYKEGSTDAAPEVPNVTPIPTTYYSSSRAQYIYNDVAVSEDMYVKHFYDGYKKSEKNMIYDVTLEIYEKGTSKLVSKYTGGLSD